MGVGVGWWVGVGCFMAGGWLGGWGGLWVMENKEASSVGSCHFPACSPHSSPLIKELCVLAYVCVRLRVRLCTCVCVCVCVYVCARCFRLISEPWG